MKFLRIAASVLLLVPVLAHAVPWFPFGPDGGDARAFAQDPKESRHVYLGTANGWIYDSHDGGRQWIRLARVGNRDDLVIDNIVVNQQHPERIVVGAWVINHPDGGIYLSKDSGHTWTVVPTMKGHSIRALANAPDDPTILAAGALDGVYRSLDAGDSWQLISPPGSTEIHEIESLAIDPVNPSIIYAGTWHLPWKTTDGGKHWNNIKNGVIEDSDVFSIIVDPRNAQTVYASACSGIYKSENAGGNFVKVQGIPSTARRTRVLMQDPKNSSVVFAGTTEGLFRTSDAGKTWLRNTGADVIVNDVYIDPNHTEHVLLATDRQGVLVSEDGGFTFRESSAGFSTRQIVSYAASLRVPANLAVGVVNDKTFGGVFMSGDGGLTWRQRSDGLGGRDVFSLLRAPDDTLLAGTGHGIFRYDGQQWMPSGMVLGKLQSAPRTATRTPRRTGYSGGGASEIDGNIFAMALVGNTVYAAGGDNVIMSVTAGLGWEKVPALEGKDWRYLAAEDKRIFVGGLKDLELSLDGGHSWKVVATPPGISVVTALNIDERGTLWTGGLEGLAYSSDNGSTWQKVPGLYIVDVNNIFYDREAHRMLVTVNQPTLAYAIAMPSLKVTYLETGWNLRFVRPVGDHLIGATLFDGVVVQPRMVLSEEETAPPAKH